MKANLCQQCPRRLKGQSSDPCSMAMDAVYAQARGEEVGCQWYINSEKHGYCFWVYVKTLDEPVTDKEICNLLGITQAILDESYKSAISKLQAIRHTEEMKDFVEAIIEYVEEKGDDKTIYFPEEFNDKVKDQENPPPPPEEKKEKPRRINSQPLHRDGKKVDIYGTYSKKTLERIKRDKKR